MSAKADERNPADNVLLPLEDAFTAAIATELTRIAAQITRGISAENAREIVRRVESANTWQALRDVLADYLRQSAEAGTTAARRQIESNVWGVKAVEVGVWDLVNDAAVTWALEHVGQLIRNVQATTVSNVSKLVSDWITNGEGLSTLTNRIVTDHGFSETRARTIAVTEVTRAFSEGNQAVWRAAPEVERKRWRTSNDELVCPACGPLYNVAVLVDEQFDSLYGRIDGPPAHPRCRCWLVPVGFEAADDDTLNPDSGLSASELEVRQRMRRESEALDNAWLEVLEEDSGFGTRREIDRILPEGRAPRGMGEEYQYRRRVHERIESMTRQRSNLERKLRQGRNTWRDRQRETRANARIAALSESINMATDIANNLLEYDIPFLDSKELFEDVFSYVQALYSQQL